MKNTEQKLISKIPSSSSFQIEKETIHFSSAFWELFKIWAPTVVSFTFSWSMPLMANAIGHLGKSDTESRDYLASATLITIFINTTCLIAHTILFSITEEIPDLLSKKVWQEQRQAEDQDHEDLENMPTDDSQESLGSHRNIISRTFKNSFVLGLIPTALPIFCFWYAKPILEALGQPADVSAISYEYLKHYSIYSIGIVALLGRVCVDLILLSFGKQLAVMSIGLINIALATIFAFGLGLGHLGLPEIGLRGIAYSFGLEPIVTFIGFSLFLKLNKDLKIYSFFKKWLTWDRQDLYQIKRLFVYGFPFLLQFVNELLANFTLNIRAGHLGKIQLATQNFSVQLLALTLMISASISQATRFLVTSLKDKSPEVAKKYIHYGALTNLFITALITIPICIYPQMFIGLMSNGNDAEILSIATKLLPIISAGALVDGVRLNNLQSLRAIGDKHLPTVISIVCLWLGVGAGYFLSKTDLGIYGLGTGYSAGLFLGFLLITLRLRKKMKATFAEIDINDTVENSHGSGFFNCCQSKRRSQEQPFDVAMAPT